MKVRPYDVRYYKDNRGKEPFTQWLEERKKDGVLVARTAIPAKIAQVETDGLYGHNDIKGHENLWKFNFGAGLRVYFCFDGEDSMVILLGGHKGEQSKNIETAEK